MLVEGGLLTEAQLDQAIAEHQRNNIKLGEYLVREGMVSSSDIVNLVSRQMGIEKYQPETYPINVQLANTIPLDMCQKHQLVPIKRSDHLLKIAMTDPMDIHALDSVEVHTNTEVEAVICTYQDLNLMISSLYGTYSGIGGVLDGMSEMQIESAHDSDPVAMNEDVEVRSLHDMAEEAPVIRLVNSILSQAVREGASDIHISPEKDYVQVRFRVDGKLHEVPAPPKSLILLIISRVKILANMDISLSRVPQDGRFTVRMDNKEINIRASTIPTIYGENLVLRLLDTSSGVYSLDHLGMSEADIRKLEPIIHKPYGMILSTGPTGSGKSTTLYSILKKINQPDINIITIEDPVEYRVNKIRQIQLNRKAGMTFASGLRAIMRQDPDVIMVGEIRDSETAGIAVQSALTGHRVLSTVHTNDAAGAITRFIDMGVEPFLVSSVVLVCIAQRLVRKVCPYCKTAWKPPRSALSYWGLDKVQGANFVKGKGCFNCMDKGYKGRTGIFEILAIDEMVQDMILRRVSSQDIMRAARDAGNLRTLKDDAIRKVVEGETTLDEAMSAVMT
ncbi:general secretion pathway protein GspE [Desulfosarcina ovata subsp. sediminis]|uniref:General secretion pathway protein GspE n=3 Tax=Desulfosarcina ovata TaxID=83564 RepID=A0A5K8A4E9_9BACT|nr:general secretion pathway protein GspE [Desulfosarcina ovata subsp. sediminis]BBO87389.1 general secretion pathway protein GspE [Desulfosarcina ovata subsp. ovata]